RHERRCIEAALEEHGFCSIRSISDRSATFVVGHDEVSILIKSDPVGPAEALYKIGLGAVRREFVDIARAGIGLKKVPGGIDRETGRQIQPGRKSRLRSVRSELVDFAAIEIRGV